MDKIHNIEEMITWLNEISKKRDYLQQKTGVEFEIFFRGVNNEAFEDIPSVYRNAGLIYNETNIYNDCLRLAPSDFPDGERVFERLAKMQHYSAPTRLLDITTNPTVSLFFSQYKGENGITGKISVYFATKSAVVNYDSRIVTILSNLSRVSGRVAADEMHVKRVADLQGRVMQSNITENYDFYYKYEKGFDRDTTKQNPLLLDKVFGDDPNIKNISRWDIHSVVCVMPRQNNARIKRQNGAFILPGIYNNNMSMPVFSLSHINNIMPVISFLRYKNFQKMDDGENTFDKAVNVLKKYLDFNDWAINRLVELNNMFVANYKLTSLESIIANRDDISADSNSYVIKRRMTIFIKIQCELMIRSARIMPWVVNINHQIVHREDLIFLHQPTTTVDKILPLLLMFQILSSEPRFIIRDSVQVEFNDTIKKHLDLLGIREEFLFPELDYVCRNIGSKYTI